MSESLSQSLTPLEEQVYLFIVDFLSERSFQPSVREIARQFGMRSTKEVALLLRGIERKGYIRRDASRSRGLTIVGLGGPARVFPVPRYLRLARERPALREENRDGFVAFDRQFIPNTDVFCIVADDRSVSGVPGILPGDLLLIDPHSPAGHTALVLARLGRDTLVRSMEHRGARTVLAAPQPQEAEIVLGPGSDYEVVGLVCGVMRGSARASSGIAERPATA
jgi:repressor LexA